MLDLARMTTEQRNPGTTGLDAMTPLEIVTAMNREDAEVPRAIQKVLPEVATAVEWIRDAFLAGGRLIYMGAGTSGRLGVLDASECPPTFGVPASMVVGLVAGGDKALRDAVENAEDDRDAGVQDLKTIGLGKNDVLVGIAASGRTPYVIAGLEYANSLGCQTVAIACNKGSAMGGAAKLAIEPVPGPEVVTGSTRLKAGTAQKLVLNMLTTASMVSIGKVYENLMVDVVQTNEKLNVRAENIVMEATGIPREEARAKIDEAEGSVKLAITMVLGGFTRQEAEQKLQVSGGRVRGALNG